MKFVKHDEITVDMEYPIAKQFTTVYSPTMAITLKLDEQVMVSQEHPPNCRNFNGMKEKGVDYYLPSKAFGYSSINDMILIYDKEVEFLSLWLRLHKSPGVETKSDKDVRTLSIYNKGELVAETSFMLTTDDWLMIKPTTETGSVVGDTLIVDA